MSIWNEPRRGGRGPGSGLSTSPAPLLQAPEVKLPGLSVCPFLSSSLASSLPVTISPQQGPSLSPHTSLPSSFTNEPKTESIPVASQPPARPPYAMSGTLPSAGPLSGPDVPSPFSRSPPQQSSRYLAHNPSLPPTSRPDTLGHLLSLNPSLYPSLLLPVSALRSLCTASPSNEISPNQHLCSPHPPHLFGSLRLARVLTALVKVAKEPPHRPILVCSSI